MNRIDGGIGGGQVLRWAVALAAIEQKPIEVEDIRGSRETPGLRPQHVAAVQAIADLTDADVSGLEVESTTITLEPDSVVGGDLDVDIGTAGSITLVFDTVLPLAQVATEPIRVTVTGGTDVKWSPPLDYHRTVKLPLLQECGVQASIEVDRRGFYPKGAGSATLEIRPSDPGPIRRTDRGSPERMTVQSLATEDLEDAEVATRQAQTAKSQIRELTPVPVQSSAEYVSAASTGSALLIAAEFEGSRAGFSALGEPGTPAESVAETAVAEFETFLDSSGAVDRHLADQLLPFLAVSGGEITTPTLTTHIETAISVLDTFGHRIEVDRHQNAVRLEASPEV